MLHVHLVYESDDATTAAVRDAVRDALHMLDLPPRWDEIRHDDPALSPAARTLAMPTVLVDGYPVLPKGGPPSRAQVFVKIQDVVSRR